jgi:hypothetical protein
MSFQRMMEIWLHENFPRVSQDEHILEAVMGTPRYIILYFNGFRIGWVSETEFAIGNAYHYSLMSNWTPLNKADPKFFDIIKERLHRIGAE